MLYVHHVGQVEQICLMSNTLVFMWQDGLVVKAKDSYAGGRGSIPTQHQIFFYFILQVDGLPF